MTTHWVCVDTSPLTSDAHLTRDRWPTFQCISATGQHQLKETASIHITDTVLTSGIFFTSRRRRGGGLREASWAPLATPPLPSGLPPPPDPSGMRQPRYGGFIWPRDRNIGVRSGIFFRTRRRQGDSLREAFWAPLATPPSPSGLPPPPDPSGMRQPRCGGFIWPREWNMGVRSGIFFRTRRRQGDGLRKASWVPLATPYSLNAYRCIVKDTLRCEDHSKEHLSALSAEPFKQKSFRKETNIKEAFQLWKFSELCKYWIEKTGELYQ